MLWCITKYEQREASHSIKSDRNMTPLHSACYYGKINIVHYLVKKGCDLEAKGFCQATPLYYACEQGHTDINFVEQGCDLNARTDVQDTPLHVAYLKGHIDIVRFIIGVRGHDLETKGQDQSSPIRHACQNGHVEVVCYLAKSGCDFLYTRTNSKDTQLHIACKNGHLSIVCYLVDEKKCDIEIKGHTLTLFAILLSKEVIQRPKKKN